MPRLLVTFQFKVFFLLILLLYFSYASSYQLEIASGLEMIGMSTSFRSRALVRYRPMQALCRLPVYEFICVPALLSKRTDSLISSSLLALSAFLPPLPQSSMNSEGRDWMETSLIGLSIQRSYSANSLAVGLCTCSHMLQEETSLRWLSMAHI